MTSHRKNNRIVSQGGLTSPKLLRQGPDFPNRSRKRWNGRHVRISCTNVTHGLSSVVIISHPNQLHICRTEFFWRCQVLHKCLCESVADISRCKYVTSSVVFMFSPNRCSNITLQICHVNVANMFYYNRCQNVTVTQKPHQNWQKYHSCTNTTDPLQWKMTPPVENDRDPLQWKMTPPRELETTSGNNS